MTERTKYITQFRYNMLRNITDVKCLYTLTDHFDEDEKVKFVSSIINENNSLDGFSIIEKNCSMVFHNTLEIDEFIFDLIMTNCEFVTLETHADLLRAANKVTSKCKRGVPKLYGNILAYRSPSSIHDCGIRVVFSDEKYYLFFNREWENYYIVGELENV